MSLAGRIERLGYWDNFGLLWACPWLTLTRIIRAAREPAGRDVLVCAGQTRRGGHLVSRLDPSDQHIPGSVQLIRLRACRPIHSFRARQVARLSRLSASAPGRRPLRRDGYRKEGGSRESQASRAVTSSRYPPGRRYSGPASGLHLAVRSCHESESGPPRQC